MGHSAVLDILIGKNLKFVDFKNKYLKTVIYTYTHEVKKGRVETFAKLRGRHYKKHGNHGVTIAIY
jgi:hypothetical protein